MTTDQAMTDFEHVLLGAIVSEPSSGYQLKRRFTTTPAAVYQPSSGALYPALRRLERRGFVTSAADSGAGHRVRHLYRVTESGRRAHAAWVRQPVVPATVARDLGLHLMRFSMMEQVLPPGEVVEFLADLAAALDAFVEQMERYLAEMSTTHSRQQWLALEHGIAVHRASAAWARRAMDALGPPASAPENRSPR